MSAYDPGPYPGTGGDDAPGARPYSYEPFPGGDDRPQRPRRPRELVISFVLWSILVLLLGAGAVSLTLFAEDFIGPLTEEGLATGVSEQEARAAAEVGTWLTIGILYVIAAFTAICAFLLWTGRGWARIALTVIGVLVVLPGAVAVVSGGVTWMLVVVTLMVVVGAVLMWLRPVTEYLGSAGTARRG